MKYKELKSYGEDKLKESNKDISLATYLIKNYLCLSIMEELNNIEINKRDAIRYKKAIDRLIRDEPIQYIVGSVSFFGYNFLVSKKVLIPRFETEELIEHTLSYISKYFNGTISIVDIGTGSGAIGITLKKKLPNSNITITDISSDALKIASKNALNLGAKVEIIKGDMLDPLIKANKKYDVIISNPPYIKEDEKIMDIVEKNEPSAALYGGQDGLKYYRKILGNASAILNPKSLIALEIGEKETVDIIDLVEKYFPNSRYEIKKDLQGRDRMIFIFNNINE